MKKGTRVRIKTPLVSERVVVDQRIDPETDAVESLVEWAEDGLAVRAWFADADLEALDATTTEG